MSARMALHIYWQDWQAAHKTVIILEQEKLCKLNHIDGSKELLKIEGISPATISGLLCSTSVMIQSLSLQRGDCVDRYEPQTTQFGW